VSVFGDLVGQERVVVQLGAAAAAAAGAAGGPGMTHAWLFTGPPGSGRSVAARAFAAALECPRSGCGTCSACHTVRAGTHADVDVVVPEGLHILMEEAREIVRRASSAPTVGPWRVIVIEDADRLEERTSNTLLKILEEPPPRAVLLLCAPAVDDLPPTIRSRCRLVTLRTPPAAAVAEVLERRDGVRPEVAAFAALAAQGHVGRARRLALDADAQRRRREVLALPGALTSVPACFVAAENLVAATVEEATAATGPVAAAETAALRVSLGDTGTGKAMPRGTAGAMKDLERRQKSRGTRSQRDALDRALADLVTFYRDVLMVQLGAAVPLVNSDLRDAVHRLAAGSAPASTLRRIEASFACQTAIDANVPPLLAVEALTLRLRAG
jgi:DNA polymerase-3 subunit delta'